MRESSVGLQAGVDARKWAVVLRRAHDVALRGGHVPAIVRRVIADSWERCDEGGVDPGDAGAPQVVEPEEAAERWRGHPLAATTDILHGALDGLLHEARHIAVVSDAGGCLLWSHGHPEVLRASERIRFTPGHSWSERSAGTNAIGTALAADRAVQVFSAEHFRCEVHGWQCSGAPIHDPETGELLGAVDVTGRFDTASPHTLALVQMVARLAEERLRAGMFERDARILGRFAERTDRHAAPSAALSPGGRVLAATGGWGELARGGRIALDRRDGVLALPDGTVAELEPLGEGVLLRAAGRAGEGPASGGARLRLELGHGPRGRFLHPGGEHRLTVRHTELATLLARHPDGLDARTLSRLLFGAPGHEVAVRAEMHRLREVLGPALGTRPYRLVGIATDLTG